MYMKKLDIDAIMHYLEKNRVRKEKFIEDAINIDFDPAQAKDIIVVEFLRGRNFKKAEEIADCVA